VLLYQLFIVAAVSALFMPFFGPMLDHHFAERQPSHGHIFFGPADAEHVHFYEAAQTHFHAHDLPAIPAGNCSESNKLPNEVAGQDDLPSEIFIPPPERPPRA
jgi:hypothetical protein